MIQAEGPKCLTALQIQLIMELTRRSGSATKTKEFQMMLKCPAPWEHARDANSSALRVQTRHGSDA